jgi:hypothetical protein
MTVPWGCLYVFLFTVRLRYSVIQRISKIYLLFYTDVGARIVDFFFCDVVGKRTPFTSSRWVSNYSFFCGPNRFTTSHMCTGNIHNRDSSTWWCEKCIRFSFVKIVFFCEIFWRDFTIQYNNNNFLHKTSLILSEFANRHRSNYCLINFTAHLFHILWLSWHFGKFQPQRLLLIVTYSSLHWQM